MFNFLCVLIMFFHFNSKTNMQWCFKHEKTGDVWYDCQGCLHESQEWAEDNGFSQCVSPNITREGTDNGLWVTANEDRWMNAEDALRRSKRHTAKLTKAFREKCALHTPKAPICIIRETKQFVHL